MMIRLHSLNAIEQYVILQMRIAQIRSGEVIAEESKDLRANMYFKNEMLLMLEKAGFYHIQVMGEYKDELATSQHKNIVFIARKE